MAEIEEALRTYLLTQSGLTALVSTRVLFDDISGGAALPAVVYQKISDIKDHLLMEQSTLERPMFQFTAYAATKAAARNISNQLKTALCDYTGTLSGIFVQYIRLDNEMSGKEQSADGAMSIYIEDLEFEVNFVKE